VLHVTDGAPRDARFRSRPDLDRAACARLRREEAARALEAGGIAPTRTWCLGAVDLEAIDAVGSLAAEVARIAHHIKPRWIVSHAYEGGHPDHDATALVVHIARELLLRRYRSAPEVFEMTGYGGSGRFGAQTFLEPNEAAPLAEPAYRRTLSCEERATKRAMLACYASTQRDVLTPFATVVERIRPAPRYSFDRAPHAGELWYERAGMGDGAEWRARAARALSGCDFVPLAWAAAE
jgi:LmbE family N-acetylglucosaminyl deacetylase